MLQLPTLLKVLKLHLHCRIRLWLLFMSCIYAITLEHFPFFVFYAVPPVISSRGGTVTVVVNEPARLECEATGVPLPSLTWLKDGSPVASVSHGLQVPINDLIEFCFRQVIIYFCLMQLWCAQASPKKIVGIYTLFQKSHIGYEAKCGKIVNYMHKRTWNVCHWVKYMFLMVLFECSCVHYEIDLSISLSGVVWWQSTISQQCTGEWYRQVHLCGCQRWRRTP